ncbi:NADPH-dependent F420 reductase [Nocardiopsis ganjiahuensis]|uniref:NADPH-dependent F420 reductase n=1 Tax=Nocardiopsis ganjiahuensis TaxID=239984 RepID=UPI0003473C7E|nr:NAD(P)-binding domain-containing protein [Nocardiopsis ganjiahuensis]
MRIGVLGTGTMAKALGTGWLRAGHEVTVGGRSRDRAEEVARALGERAGAASPAEAVAGRDAVLLAVGWEGMEPALRSAGAHEGSLAGVPVLDPTNAVEHGTGVLLPGGSAAGRVAELAPGARVVKAFHLFPAAFWERPAEQNSEVTVAVCGDDLDALRTSGRLVADLGATQAVLGPLARARQLEEAAGFLMGLALSGVDPHAAVPSLG